MPKVLQYKKDSLIYCNGDEADKVFVLHSGRVGLIYDDIETGKNIREKVKPGEFFGVKSALGRYPREENAVTYSDSVVAEFTVTEFELYAISNTKIILKMLKIFSNQMRRIHTRVSLLQDKKKVDPDEGLFSIGERYMRKKRYPHAIYTFNRYLEYYPDGRGAETAAKNIRFAETAIGRTPSRKTAGADRKKAPEANAVVFNASGVYYNGINLIKSEKFQEAMEEFAQVVANSKDGSLWAVKSVFETGRCLYFLNKFEECEKHYMNMLAQHPVHPDKKDAMFYMGQSNEKLGKKDAAIDWYKKIVAMPGTGNDGTRAKALQALEVLGG